MANKTTPSPDRKSTFITAEAHEVLPYLCKILAEEKRVSKYNYIDAISNAVLAEARRAARRQERRQTQTTA